MTPRERILALAKRVRKDGERDTALGIQFIDRGNEELLYAARLDEVIPKLTDRQCAQIVADWGDERKPS